MGDEVSCGPLSASCVEAAAGLLVLALEQSLSQPATHLITAGSKLWQTPDTASTGNDVGIEPEEKQTLCICGVDVIDGDWGSV